MEIILSDVGYNAGDDSKETSKLKVLVHARNVVQIMAITLSQEGGGGEMPLKILGVLEY